MTKVTCRVCLSGAVPKRHCPQTNTTCDWSVCPHCKVTLDRRRRRGITPANKTVTWPAEDDDVEPGAG